MQILALGAGSERRSCESGMRPSWMLARGRYSRTERGSLKSENKVNPLRHLGEITPPLFRHCPHYLNNLVCDIISPRGRVVPLFKYLSILDSVLLGTKTPCERRQARTNNYNIITARL